VGGNVTTTCKRWLQLVVCSQPNNDPCMDFLNLQTHACNQTLSQPSLVPQMHATKQPLLHASGLGKCSLAAWSWPSWAGKGTKHALNDLGMPDLGSASWDGTGGVGRLGHNNCSTDCCQQQQQSTVPILWTGSGFLLVLAVLGTCLRLIISNLDRRPKCLFLSLCQIWVQQFGHGPFFYHRRPWWPDE